MAQRCRRVTLDATGGIADVRDGDRDDLIDFGGERAVGQDLPAKPKERGFRRWREFLMIVR